MSHQSLVPDYFQQTESQVLDYWSSLTQEQRHLLSEQLRGIDLAVLQKQKELIHDAISNQKTFESFDDFSFSGNHDHQSLGAEIIAKGQLGCLLLAGGQGTRLEFNGPKGTYPISVIKNKSLFQLCAEKVAAASRWAGHPLQLAIMTSPENDQETRAFFEQNQFFGLNTSQVSFFVQDSLPLLDSSGHLFLQTPWQIATGPDGNGNSLLRFAQSGLLSRWRDQGIKYLNIILIDNPLSDPFDAELVGFHQIQKADITIKCTEKIDPDENVGLLVKDNGKCRVVEYSEMSGSEKNDRRADGRLKHCCANLSLFCMSLSFIQDLAIQLRSLPLHKAWKKANYLDAIGTTAFSTRPICWKFETFIFDWLAYSKKIAALIYPREECFAPLKNLVGSDTPEDVKKALQSKEKKIIQSITHCPPPDFPFELEAEFYYPTPELLAKWRGKTWP